MAVPLTIRRWVPSDFPQVLALSRRLHELSRFSFLPFDELCVRRLFDLYITSPHKRCGLVALHGPLIVGVLAGHVQCYTFCDELVASDQVFFVDPAHAGGWAAVRLMKAFRAWAIESGAREIHFATATGIDGERAGRFLERLDFEPIGGLYACRLD